MNLLAPIAASSDRPASWILEERTRSDPAVARSDSRGPFPSFPNLPPGRGVTTPAVTERQRGGEGGRIRTMSGIRPPGP